MGAALTAENIQILKAKGFLRNRGTDCFSGRIVVPGGVYTAEQLEQIGECARIYGNGKIVFTSRLSAEIPGIAYEKVDDACAYIEGLNSGLLFGGTGAKIRPITSCKGTNCIFGCSDTQGLAKKIHDQYYLGMKGTVLPHKFKIAVGGCPNSCMKPSLNDFGIEAQRNKKEVCYKIFVGGMWGKRTRQGSLLTKIVPEEEIMPVLDKTIQWFRENGEKGERLGSAIDRIGLEALESYLLN